VILKNYLITISSTLLTPGSNLSDARLAIGDRMWSGRRSCFPVEYNVLYVNRISRRVMIVTPSYGKNMLIESLSLLISNSLHTQLQILRNRMLITRLKIFTGNILTVYIILNVNYFYIETIVY